MCGYQTLVPDYTQIRADLRAKWRIPPYSRGFQFWKSLAKQSKALNKMSRLTQQSSDDNRYILVAKLDNARNLLNVLRAVYFKEVRKCYNRVDIDMP